MSLFDKLISGLRNRNINGEKDRKAARPSDKEKSEKLSGLTRREKDLLDQLVEGYTLQESADILNIKYSTANTHMTSLYRKLGVRSRAELIILYRSEKNTQEVTQ